MKSFWGAFLGALLAIIVINLLGFLLIMAIIFSSIGQISMQKEKPFKVKRKSVLHIRFDNQIFERTPKNPFETFDFIHLENHSIGLNDILENIEKAKNDPRIAGIYLDITSVPAGIATVEEIRNALLNFKSASDDSAKKFIVAYGEIYTQSAYYLCTAADKIYLHPEGIVDFRGLSTQIMFFKKMLDKLEIDVQIFRHGKFKSAIEPFDLEKMSAENRQQIMAYIHSIWNHLLGGISSVRGISTEELNRYCDNLMITDGESALKNKLVDQLVYKDEMLDILKELTEAKSEKKINFVELHQYTRTPSVQEAPETKNKIALIYAVGSIESGKGDDQTIGSERISKAIRQARQDTNVKAIVLRVNSPGGSSLASDVIWREMVLAKKEKPVVVSMSDVAASGGYYISCPADAIFALPVTITGSIGVFGILPNMQKFFSNKLGITVDTANTNRHADLGNLFRPATKTEGKVVQKWIEDVYAGFTRKVAEGRNMNVSAVDSIGQGRIWSGEDGKKIGLVDELGGIKDAIAYAAKKAGLEEYRIQELPRQKDPFQELFSELMQEETQWLAGFTQMIWSFFGSEFLKTAPEKTNPNLERLKLLLKYKGVQARMPYDIVIY